MQRPATPPILPAFPPSAGMQEEWASVLICFFSSPSASPTARGRWGRMWDSRTTRPTTQGSRRQQSTAKKSEPGEAEICATDVARPQVAGRKGFATRQNQAAQGLQSAEAQWNLCHTRREVSVFGPCRVCFVQIALIRKCIENSEEKPWLSY